MATFEAQIEGLTQISIDTTSAPTQSEVNQFIADAVTCTVNRIVATRPQEAMKFAATSELTSTSGTSVSGQILSVSRGHESTTVLRGAGQILPQARYDATDIDSLNYRSAYNPCFYILDGKVYVLPDPSSSSKGYITQLSYDTTVDCTSDSALTNFPTEYLNLIILYSSALACQSAASDIQNNMPTRPTAPVAPEFLADEVDLPSIPVYSAPPLNLDFSNIRQAIIREDFELADKYSDLFQKKVDEYEKLNSQEEKLFQKDADVFKADLDRITKNADREVQVDLAEYRSEIYKYQYDITEFSSALQEKFSKYKWFMEQYIALMNEYNASLQLMTGKRQAPARQAPKMPAQQQEQPQEGEGY